jgi:hypothetical protein
MAFLSAIHVGQGLVHRLVLLNEIRESAGVDTLKT